MTCFHGTVHAYIERQFSLSPAPDMEKSNPKKTHSICFSREKGKWKVLKGLNLYSNRNFGCFVKEVFLCIISKLFWSTLSSVRVAHIFLAVFIRFLSLSLSRSPRAWRFVRAVRGMWKQLRNCPPSPQTDTRTRTRHTFDIGHASSSLDGP